MKHFRYFIALYILLLASVISYATTITASQPIRDPRGNRLNGRIVFVLPAPAVDLSTNTMITPVARPVYVSNGALVGTTTLVANSNISPKMYYDAYLYDATGRWLSTYHYYVTGTTFDLGAQPMTPVTTSNVSVADLTNMNSLGVLTGGIYVFGSDTGMCRESAGLVDFGNGTFCDKSGGVAGSTVKLYKSDGTVPALITNDTLGGVLITANSGKTWEINNSGQPVEFGATSGSITFAAPAISGTSTNAYQAVNDTFVYRTTTDVLSNKTLTAPIINGTPTGTGVQSVTLKKGSGAGAYSSASTGYVQVDGTNLTFTVTVPTGWKLTINSSFRIGTSTAAVACNAGLADGGTIVVETSMQSVGAGIAIPASLAWVINGDGAVHTVDLRYKTSNAADSVIIGNSSTTDLPVIIYILSPSS